MTREKATFYKSSICDDRQNRPHSLSMNGSQMARKWPGQQTALADAVVYSVGVSSMAAGSFRGIASVAN
ncbi:hypothetical protein [Paraburkholderia fynbosensis]|uniref:Uncharacterized protein n=1 Tax=Paraburkholderia fynbosensis TaxID=1200993 RepID=A0A6J5FW87_9BURK|nr:hypothetical protein [Paraburkholderia fynbosensis]CAB3785338.1 hypothetical protein LMG27177_01819 [Paraburkholderia fynbosensis]